MVCLKADTTKAIAVRFTGGETATDIVKLTPDSTAQTEYLVKTPAREGVEGLSLSPDGR